MNPVFDRSSYHEILCRQAPAFLEKYLSVDIFQRLAGVGLLCGTDWTPLYKNPVFYSRLEHSIGVALILWNFTHDKKQTIAGLLHDVSTPAFSHVSDFRNGDALKQESTESENKNIIHQSMELKALLEEDGLSCFDVDDYHRFPIADNEIPMLSADRLEYMFPSGCILNGSFSMQDIARLYGDISICYNELGQEELGFKTQSLAVEYCRRVCCTSHVLQKNENKLTLQLLAEILSLGISLGIISEQDLFVFSEKQLIEKFDFIAEGKNSDSGFKKFSCLYRTFRTMKKIDRSSEPEKGCFCISLDVKQRYINPLVALDSSVHPKGKRITEISKEAAEIVDNFLNFQDSPFGCVKIVEN